MLVQCPRWMEGIFGRRADQRHRPIESAVYLACQEWFRGRMRGSETQPRERAPPSRQAAWKEAMSLSLGITFVWYFMSLCWSSRADEWVLVVYSDGNEGIST